MSESEGATGTQEIETTNQPVLFVPTPPACVYWIRTATAGLIVLLVLLVGILVVFLPPGYGKLAMMLVVTILLVGTAYITYRLYTERQADIRRVEQAYPYGLERSSQASQELARVFARSRGGLAKEQIPHIKAVADPLLQAEIEAIELRDELLEPEPIQSSLPMKDPFFRFGLIMMIFSFIHSIVDRNWFSGVGGFFFLFFFILPSIRMVRERLPVFRDDNSALIVGPGWSKHTRKNISWSVADSILLLRVKGSKSLGTLDVRLLGPKDDLPLTFESVRDPEFVRLWQRWMHPNPRLELSALDV